MVPSPRDEEVKALKEENARLKVGPPLPRLTGRC